MSRGDGYVDVCRGICMFPRWCGWIDWCFAQWSCRVRKMNKGESSLVNGRSKDRERAFVKLECNPFLS
jgi:hypothetical protein